MRYFLMAFVALIVFLEHLRAGAGLELLLMIFAVVQAVIAPVPGGLAIALLLLVPAFLVGADWRAKAMLEEEAQKLRDRQQKWRIF